MRLRKALFLVILFIAVAAALLSIPSLQQATALSARRLLQGVAASAALVAVIIGATAAGAASRRGASWSLRSMSHAQRLRLLLSVSMACMFAGSVVRLVLPPLPSLSIVSAVLISVSIPGNLMWIRASSLERRNCAHTLDADNA